MAATTRTGAQWRHHDRTGRVGTLVVLAATLVLVAVAGLLWGIDAVAIVGAVCGFPAALLLGLAAYSMGPGSGWEGLWTVRVFRDADDVARRVRAALANAGRAPHDAPDRRPARWLRIVGPPKGAPIELPDGTLVWILAREDGGPATPPATEVVLQPPPKLDPVELEHLKATVLAAMQPGYAAKEE